MKNNTRTRKADIIMYEGTPAPTPCLNFQLFIISCSRDIARERFA